MCCIFPRWTNGLPGGKCWSLNPGTFRKLHNGYTMVTQRNYRWKATLGTCHFNMVVSQLKLSVTMAPGASNQGRGARVKQARVTPLHHFCVSGVIIFFQYHIDNFFSYYFKVSTIHDEYMRYWNNNWMYLSNQVNGNTCVRTKKATGARIRVKTCVHLTPDTYFTNMD